MYGILYNLSEAIVIANDEGTILYKNHLYESNIKENAKDLKNIMTKSQKISDENQNINILVNEQENTITIKTVQDVNMIIFLSNDSLHQYFLKLKSSILILLGEIIGNIVILENTTQTKSQQKLIKDVKGASFSLLKIINDLIELSNNALILNKTHFVLDACLTTVLDIVKSSKISTRVNILTPDIIVYGDMERVKNILVTILQTSILQVKNEDIPVISIKLHLIDDGDYFQFIFKNNGPQLNLSNSTQEQESIIRDTNLCLLLCLKICKLMDGNLVFKSNELENVFTLDLKLKMYNK